jgi:hypothetical protein
MDRAEQVKWWDALDCVVGQSRLKDVERGVDKARKCCHPDAVWLASLFPSGEAVGRERMLDVVQ